MDDGRRHTTDTRPPNGTAGVVGSHDRATLRDVPRFPIPDSRFPLIVRRPASIVYVLLFLFTAVSPASARQAEEGADDLQRVVDLRGTWRFRIGDDSAWSDPDLDDADWESIFVPSNWEEEGYWGYDGFAWYRRHFRLEKAERDQVYVVDVGRIDDVSAVYVNGYYVGTAGRFPPKFETAYHLVSRYRVPTEYLREGGDNVIAIRVYDQMLEGGLIKGRPGLYAAAQDPILALDLGGPWKFRTGDRSSWSAGDLDDAGWDDVTVPGTWEPQGYAWYDGFAWYRKRFFVPKSLAKEDLVLMLGKIDDLDETFLNGYRVGGVGRLDTRRIEGYEWQVVRLYDLPDGVLRYGHENVLAVRVYDGLDNGGIFEGPIGLARRDQALQFNRRPEPFSFWKWLREWMEK